MAPSEIACPRCKTPMQEGFLPYILRGGYMAAFWVEGRPERSIWTGLRLRGKTRVPVTAFRCPSCGCLEFFAE